ncbi:hypothetical protein D9611_006080 [Ephemerocybe angulata]|uniref:Uncharacterized protein n=1 Tax=Ephemerocybe angulata TaxID=980116 RepID=A0A8H5CIF3_9AGAR|nr:hypothetical protein D9611_006080 [Tulosesus angulatus]
MNATNSGSLPRREAFEDELPPAYTPSADIQHGETTVEYGPSRPFQPPPASSNSPSVARPQQQSHQPQTSGRSQRMGSFLNQLAGQLQELAIRPPGSRTESHMTGASSSSYPGRSHYAPPAMQRPLSTGSAPPPLPPRQAPGYEQEGPSRPVPTSATSDFAREFYAAGAAIPGEDSQGPTPPPLPAAPVVGKPTTEPTPGHPYLHNNQLLVYPRGYECEKLIGAPVIDSLCSSADNYKHTLTSFCMTAGHNIGYKLPNLKPCKRCWPKYGKPFTGPLVYSFGEETAAAGPSSNFQRPLPPPPPTGRPRWNTPAGYPGAAVAAHANASRVPGPTLLSPPTQNLHPLFSPSRFVPGPAVYGVQDLGRRPPPGAVVYGAGDARLGGRRCWRCEGQGTVSFMLIDREQCPIDQGYAFYVRVNASVRPRRLMLDVAGRVIPSSLTLTIPKMLAGSYRGPPSLTGARDTDGSPASVGAKVCRFYGRGACRFGKQCLNLHVEPDGTSAKPIISTNPSHSSTLAIPFHPTKEDHHHDAMSAQPYLPTGISLGTKDNAVSLESQLKPPVNASPKLAGVVDQDERRKILKARPCFAWASEGGCAKGEDCWYKHDDQVKIEAEVERKIQAMENEWEVMEEGRRRQAKEVQRKEDEEGRRRQAEEVQRKEDEERRKRVGEQKKRDEERRLKETNSKVKKDEEERKRREKGRLAMADRLKLAEWMKRAEDERAERLRKAEEERARLVERDRRAKEHSERVKRAAEERAERVRREEEERAERVRRAEEERAERDRKGEEYRKERDAQEKRKLDEYRRKMEDRRTREAQVTLRIVVQESNLVTFAGGLEIKGLLPGFDPCMMTVSGLPLDAAEKEIAGIFLEQGIESAAFHVESCKSEEKGTGKVAKVLISRKVAEVLVVGLDGLEFRDRTLKFEVKSMSGAGKGTMSSYIQQRETRVLTITWWPPSTSMVAVYGSVEEARSVARECHGRELRGRKITVQMNSKPEGPAARYWVESSLKFGNLDPGTQVDEIVAISGTSNVRQIKSNTYDLEAFTLQLKERLCRDGGQVDSFQMQTLDDGRLLKATAEFASREDLEKKVKANIPEAHRYGIAIVKRQYEAQKEQWAAMAEDKRGGKAFVKVRERKEGCAQINVHGSDKKEVGLLKVRVEALVRGEQLDASHWHSKFLWSAEGIADDVFERTRIHVYVDRKVLALRIYGAHGHTAVEAKALIREEVIRLNSMEHTIPIPRHLVRPFVDGDALKLLKEALGEDNISLEVTPSIACIRLSGGDDVIKHALKLVAENVAAPRTRDPTRIEAESDAPSCPVCYDSVTHPDTLVCGHSYCDPCLRHYLTSAASSAIFPLVCMGDGATCNRPISLPVIQRYLTQPKFNLLVDSVFSSHIRSNPQKYKFCPTPDCVQIYSLNSDQKIHQCPACLSETCLLNHGRAYRRGSAGPLSGSKASNAVEPSASSGASNIIQEDHGEGGSKAEEGSVPRSAMPCFAWQSFGRCRKGDQCEFKHSSGTTHPGREKQRVDKGKDSVEKNARERALKALQDQDRRRQQDALMTLQLLIKESNLVTFGPGLAIKHLIPGFDLCKITIRELPQDASMHEITDLFRHQGLDDTMFKLVSSRRVGATQIAEFLMRTEEANVMAVGLKDLEFRESRLVFEVGANAAWGSMKSAAAQGSDLNTLTIMWSLPSTAMIATYDTIDEARLKAGQLDRRMCRGRQIHAVLNLRPTGPAARYWSEGSVKITNLDPETEVGEVMTLAGTQLVRGIKSNTYDQQAFLAELKMRLASARYIEASFETEKLNNNRMKAVAGFVDREAAVKAVGLVERGGFVTMSSRFTTQWPKLQVLLPSEHQYTSNISGQQYQAQKAQWDAMAGQSKEKKAYIRANVRGNGRVFINVEGSDEKEVGSLKVRVEGLVAGERLGVEYWHSMFASPKSKGLFERIANESKVFVMVDGRYQSLRLFGSSEGVARAKEIIREEVERLALMEWDIPIARQSVRFFVATGLQVLKDALGDENVTLDVASRECKIKLRGGEEDIQRARKLVEESLLASSLGVLPTAGATDEGGSLCPICYDTPTLPEVLSCGHSSCEPCLRHYLTSAGPSSAFPLVCMGGDATCTTPIPIPVIQRHLAKQRFDQLVDTVFTSHIQTNVRRFKYCTTPDCTRIYQCDTGVQFHQCPSCFSKICSLCNEEAHEGMTCEERRIQSDPAEQERLNNEWATTNNVKRCPSCSVMTEKTYGCNHMTCRCGEHWCWICRMAFGNVVPFDDGPIHDHLIAVHGGVFAVEDLGADLAQAARPAPLFRYQAHVNQPFARPRPDVDGGNDGGRARWGIPARGPEENAAAREAAIRQAALRERVRRAEEEADLRRRIEAARRQQEHRERERRIQEEAARREEEKKEGGFCAIM